MSKNKKAGKKHNPNRPRSKNNPVGKRNGPQIDHSSTTRAAGTGPALCQMDAEGGLQGAHIMGIPKGRRGWRVSAILVGMVKSEGGLSYWGLVKHFEKHPDDLERCELSRPYSRAQYQLQV